MAYSEKRYLNISVKAESDGTFNGILSTYGNVDLVGDVCEKGCFDGSISRKGTHFPLLFNHNDSEPIGSFNITDTSENLAISGKFNLEVQRGREIHALVKAGDIKGLSIGYMPVKATYDETGVRHLLEVELFEGSITPFPANPLATAEAKKMRQDFKQFKSALIRAMKSKRKTDDEIEEIVEATEKEIENPINTDEKNRKEAESEEEETDTEKEEESKTDDEATEEKEELTEEEIEELKKQCESLKEELSKLKEEMNTDE